MSRAGLCMIAAVIGLAAFYPFAQKKWNTDQADLRQSFQAPVRHVSVMDVISSSPVQNNFSAIRVVDDLNIAHSANQDFLTFYLSTHFPKTISAAQIQSLKDDLAALEKERPIPFFEFKRAMLFFFLALAETKALDNSGDAQAFATIASHWEAALQHFENSKDIGFDMTHELRNVLQQADMDSDGKLNGVELKSILDEHSDQRTH